MITITSNYLLISLLYTIFIEYEDSKKPTKEVNSTNFV